ncbi:MAG TPA: hypothetical protein ENH80_06870 [Phycisphaerae bacterium]|nr:hypothetical protein [Phycisphaerae bacterium]HDZ43647.1 hypothetical protein [Phycisphaerae bacterium]
MNGLGPEMINRARPGPGWPIQVRTLCGNDAPAEIRSAGRAARSALWRQIKSRAVGCPVVATTCDEPTSLGPPS